jgi:hypothetical protein
VRGYNQLAAARRTAKEGPSVTNIGASIFLIALGAILAFAVTVQIEGIDLNMVGVILMVLGVIYLLLSLLFWADFAPYNTRRRRERVYEDREV